jgi:hypothetical protein
VKTPQTEPFVEFESSLQYPKRNFQAESFALSAFLRFFAAELCVMSMEILDRMPWAAQNAVFQRLAEVAEVSKLSKEERLDYDHALKRYRDTLNAMTGAEDLEPGRLRRP